MTEPCYLCLGSESFTLGGQHIDCPECTSFPRWFDPGPGPLQESEIEELWRDHGGEGGGA